MNKTYICIDLKSFYASVECIERNLNPLTTNLVVADFSKTEKTICLAVTPSLKSYGISGRARLFDVVKKVREINYKRKLLNNNKKFIKKSYLTTELINNNIELDYIIAPPQMSLYIKYSTMIYSIYLKYIAPEDMFVYSIDEVFLDVTNYLKNYKMSPKDLVSKIIKDVYETTGITATAGIGTNLYLCKIAMDVVAKHSKPNSFGVRIAELDEMSYRKLLWNHKPLSDFWRIGEKTASKLNENNMYTLGDIARCSVNNEDLLYKLFGINAELLIDHAWGYEPCNIKDIKSYKPNTTSISSGQVLEEPYNYEKTKIIIKEMTDLLVLELVEKKLVTSKIVLTIFYDVECLINPKISNYYCGEITTDQYGRKVPKHSRGTINLDYKTSLTSLITKKSNELFELIINPNLLTRKINLEFCNLQNESEIKDKEINYQFDLFSNVDCQKKELEIENQKDERKLQETVIKLKNKYGKNIILKGMNLEKGATTIKRNKKIGGHKA